MKGRFDFRKSIYLEMVALLLVAIAIGAAFFGLTNLASDFAIDTFIRKTEFNQKRSVQQVQNLQTYVTEEAITYEHLEMIEEWLKLNPEVLVQIYDDNYLVYDSVNGLQEEVQYQREEVGAAVWENFYELYFPDRTVEISLYGNFDLVLYRTTTMLQIVLSLVVFLFVFFVGIGQKTKYIVKLREEIDILEGGSLDYPITVSGKDELANLARGLDNMRISFRQQIEEGERISKTSHDMITQISHDLRTPLTALTLYAEILQNSDLSQKQQQEYRNKILKKVNHMKDLSDHLLEFSMDVENPETTKLEWITPHEAFYEELSELIAYLSQQELKIETDIQWDSQVICVSTEYITRIFNNISSNVLRYAEPKKPISISSSKTSSQYTLSFENKVAKEKQEQGNGIGVHSIEAMMQELGGSCRIENNGEVYRLSLDFRCY